MKKIMVSLKNKQMLLDTLELTDAYLIGFKDFSVNMPAYFNLDEIKEFNKIIKDNKKEIFVSLNKNMFSDDLKKLEEILEQLELLSITGICFYDVSIPSIVKRRTFKTPLVWSQEHFTTNYLTINYWLDEGVTYTELSREITKEEIKEIKAKTNSKLITQIFGYIPMFYSKRPLITNYKKYFNLKSDSDIYYMEQNNKKYLLKEDGYSLEGYYSDILNAYECLDELASDYLLFNSFEIDNDIFIKVIECYKNKDIETLKQLYPLDNGFFDKKTVYRVRDL